MRVHHVTIQNFRGVKDLEWTVPQPLVCLVGPNDSGKTTLLDAIEYALSDRWGVFFTDQDFTDSDTSRPITIEVTVGQLPSVLVSDEHLGHLLRGWSTVESKHVEAPGPQDDLVLTVRLKVDASLEPTWWAVKPALEPQRLSSRHRRYLGLARIGGNTSRHLAWGKGSALSRLCADRSSLAEATSGAIREARRAMAATRGGDGEALTASASAAQTAAIRYGVAPRTAFVPSIDAKDLALGSSVLALHDGDVSLARSGLGTRRLVSLAIERESIPEGAILLFDEIEHGLEPHRLRHLIRTLNAPGHATQIAPEPGVEDEARSRLEQHGQTIFTSHSPRSIVELSAEQLGIVRRARSGQVLVTSVPASLQSIVRRAPEALLARRIVVCEGKTEVGIVRVMDSPCEARHGEPFACRGVEIVYGEGANAPDVAQDFLKLGYSVVLVVDSDDAGIDSAVRTFEQGGGKLIRWDGKCSVEERICLDLPLPALQEIVDCIVRDHGGPDALLGNLQNRLGRTRLKKPIVEEWLVGGFSEGQIRDALGKSAKKAGWFKRIDFGEHLGAIIHPALPQIPETDLAKKVAELEDWLYE